MDDYLLATAVHVRVTAQCRRIIQSAYSSHLDAVSVSDLPAPRNLSLELQWVNIVRAGWEVQEPAAAGSPGPGLVHHAASASPRRPRPMHVKTKPWSTSDATRGPHTNTRAHQSSRGLRSLSTRDCLSLRMMDRSCTKPSCSVSSRMRSSSLDICSACT